MIADPDPTSGPVATRLRAVTVLGPVGPDALGFVLPHEHLTVDNRIHHVAWTGLDPMAPVTPEVLGELRVRPHALASNMVLDDDDAALADLVAYRGLGGRTLVEQTPKGMGRDLGRLVRFARESGVQVVAGTGWYVANAHGDLVSGRPVDALAAELVADLVGPGDGPRAGIIGEIGISRDDFADEWRVLDAALAASGETGAPVWIHQTTTAPMRRIIDRLAAPDVDRSRVVLCHCDYDLRDIALHREAVAMGLTVEFDLFGMPVWSRGNWVHAPSDTLRVERLLELAADGGADRLLISQDVCMKIQLTRYGGFGYGHLLGHVRELFDGLGGDAATWDAITRTNPARLLTWSAG